MNNVLNKGFIFIGGVVVGSLVTYAATKKYYRDLANLEIEEMREYYGQKLDEFSDIVNNREEDDFEDEPTVAEARHTDTKADIYEYAQKLEEAGYTNYSTSEKKVEDSKTEEDGPYVISPEEFGEEYRTETLIYYDDDILADQSGECVDIGLDPSEHFGEYEEDAVHVRDDVLEVDYEILKVEDSYFELMEEE